MKKQIPAIVKMTVFVTNGERNAQIDAGFGPLNLPSKKDIKEALANVEQSVQAEAGEDWRLMTRQEVEDHLIRTATGLERSDLDAEWEDD